MNDSRQSPTSEPFDDVIGLRELLGAVWAGKWLIGGITFGAAILAAVVSLMLANIYRAEALLAPNDQEAAGGLSALAAQYGGLASLAGINIGGQGADKTGLALEVLKSRKFVTEFIDRHDLMVPLMAANGWSFETGELEIDADEYDVASGEWVRRVRPPRTVVPSLQEAYEEFIDVLSVSQDKQSGFVRIRVEHYSPEVAKQWVDWLIYDLNSLLMRRDVAEAEQAISYLNKQIESTSLAELRSVFFSLIEEQTKKVMLAKMSDEYVFRTLDPAVIPEMKSRPKRSLIVVLSALLGSLFAMTVVLVLESNRRPKDENANPDQI